MKRLLRGRTGAAAALFLSSLLPGLGQLYNRQWTKAGVMLGATLVLGLAVERAVARVFDAASIVLSGVPSGDPVELAAVLRRMAPAMLEPGVQSTIRTVLLPAVLGLAVLVLWSMGDAYRQARRRPPAR
jgi:hypothetical protein